jgi:hypothetical protein
MTSRADLVAPYGRVVRRLQRYDWLVFGAVFILILDAGTWVAYIRSGQFPPLGADYAAYQGATQSWLSGGPFFRPYQLAGPYPLAGYADTSLDPILYPPVILALFIPMMAIPVLWWALPIAVIGIVVWKNRTPSRLFFVTALALWPTSVFLVTNGSPTLWLVAFLALATVTPVFAPLLLLKPTLWPFAVYRINERGWWLGMGLLGAASLFFASLWPDYLTAVLNARDHPGLLHSVSNIPALMIPLLVSRRPSTGGPN